MSLQKTILAMVIFLMSTPSWSEVFIRWTQPSVPPATSLGVDELVVPLHSKALIANAYKAGYRVHVEVPISQVSSVSRVPFIAKLGGMVLDPGDGSQKQINNALSKLRVVLPGVTIRVLDPRGQQPEMKGQLVTERNGILQVSSATAQPWITSNLALIRFDQVLHPGKIPMYGFRWNSSDSAKREQGPEEPDYLLAVAEAGAFHADLILDLHEKLQKDLLQDNRAAWETLGNIKRYLAFSSQMSDGFGDPEADVGVLVGDYQDAYEPANLLARHNIPFRLLRTLNQKTKELDTLDVLVIFRTLNKEAVTVIEDFASQGGVVVLFDSHGPNPWRFHRLTESGQQLASHRMGKGQIIELGSPVGDPEAFAQDIRRLIDNGRIAISFWNALTTIAVSYRKPDSDERIVELVNYAREPLSVQIQIKGSFSSIRYESPEDGCCKYLAGVQRDGYTEFVVPGLTVAGRVRLAGQSAAAP
jgi:hypothetical protein